jgi:hypothetical protein
MKQKQLKFEECLLPFDLESYLISKCKDRRSGFDPGSVRVGFVVDKVALGQACPRVLRFYPVNLIPAVLHYSEKRKKKLIIFITGLHNKP